MERKEPLRDWSSAEIRGAIKMKGVTVEELAELWGVPVGSLYNSMRGPVYWGCKVLIADFLGVSLDALWPEQVALRQEKADRRARSLLEARAVAARQVA